MKEDENDDSKEKHDSDITVISDFDKSWDK